MIFQRWGSMVATLFVDCFRGEGARLIDAGVVASRHFYPVRFLWLIGLTLFHNFEPSAIRTKD